MKKQLSLILLTYFRLSARIQLAKIKLLQKLHGQKLTIIGVTGSTGKTSTIQVIKAALSPSFSVKSTTGSNSEYGIPLNILNIKVTGFSALNYLKYVLLTPIKLLTSWRSFQIYLVEMGIDGPKEPQNMSYLLKIIKPDIGIFLNVNPVHSQYFDNTVSKNIKDKQRLHQILLNIAIEKAKLINSLPSTALAIINGDDTSVMSTTQITLAPKLIFSHLSGFNLQLLSSSVNQQGSVFNFKYQNKSFSINFPQFVLPDSFQTSLASAFLVSTHLGISPKKIINNIEKHLSLPAGRSNILKGINHSQIIDSTYNSSPYATQQMLQVLSQFPSPKISVLGDMRELGLQSSQAHKDLYSQAQKFSDQIISIGPETKKYFGDKSKKFDNWWSAADYLTKNIPQNSTILVKGSQNTIFLEELVKQILANPDDSSQLCRQSPHWLKIKNKFRNSIPN